MKLLACLLVIGSPLAAQQPPTVSMPPSAATDPAVLAAATGLIALMNVDATLDRIYVQLAPVFAQGVIGAMAGEAKARDLIGAIQQRPDGQQRLVAILSQEFMAAMRRQYPALKRGLAQEYAVAFTREELEAVAAFYRSGPGAKVLRLQPELQQKMSERGRELGRTAGAEAGMRAVERAGREILEINGKPGT